MALPRVCTQTSKALTHINTHKEQTSVWSPVVSIMRKFPLLPPVSQAQAPGAAASTRCDLKVLGRSGDLAHGRALLLPSCLSSSSSPCLCPPRPANTWHSSYPCAPSCSLELWASKNKSKQHQGLGGLRLPQRQISGHCVGGEANTTWPFVERQLFLCLKSSDTESRKEPQDAGNPASSLLEVCFGAQLKKTHKKQKNPSVYLFLKQREDAYAHSLQGQEKIVYWGDAVFTLKHFFSPNVKLVVILSWKPARCWWAWDKNTHGDPVVSLRSLCCLHCKDPCALCGCPSL